MEQSFLKQVWGLVGKFVRPHKKVLIISFIISIISTALGMIQPIFVKVLIDKILLARNYDLLVIFLIVVISVLIIGFILRVGNSYIYTRFSARILFTMREELFAHLQRIPLSFFTKKKIGDIHARIASDMADIQEMITKTLPDYFFNFLTCIITVAILIWLNWQMALMSFAALPLAMYIIHRIKPKLISLARRVAESNADISHFLFESLSGNKEIRAFGAEEVEHSRLQEKHSSLLDTILRYHVLGIFSRSVPMLYRIANTLVVFGYGGFLVMQNSLSIGSLVAFSIYQGRVFEPLRAMMDGFLAIQKTKASMDRVGEILEVPAVSFESGGNIAYAQSPATGSVNFENVSFAYDSEEPILENVTFHIPPGK